ncbi:hypothetical protein PCANC_28151 [Puccinia coronata f. sp. avenae]|uniref:Uncharacterized protein n=1 Tax=Puccinia coronata f. sp. avenae TaxID=200324 RepID=A0A2N5TDV1_9BASI|nr:hypothetical protein PCANC_28151 [Puccinia coronata f. sp. avenae]
MSHCLPLRQPLLPFTEVNSATKPSTASLYPSRSTLAPAAIYHSPSTSTLLYPSHYYCTPSRWLPLHHLLLPCTEVTLLYHCRFFPLPQPPSKPIRHHDHYLSHLF